jgi:hypothetical protein
MFRREYDDLCVRNGESERVELGISELVTDVVADVITHCDADGTAARHDERESHVAVDQRNRRIVRAEHLRPRNRVHRRVQRERHVRDDRHRDAEQRHGSGCDVYRHTVRRRNVRREIRRYER